MTLSSILAPPILALVFATTAQASESCYRSLAIGSGKYQVLLTNNSLIGGEVISGSCLETFIDSKDGMMVLNERLPVVLQLEQDMNQLLNSVQRITAVTIDIKIEITTANGSGTLKAYSR